MGKITILPETTIEPITLMGERAGVCWGADVSERTKNFKRGLDCLKSGHGRVMEYVNVEMIIDGYSARVIREWYTHLGGAPTRLQASTRYMDYDDFEYVIPHSVNKNTTSCQIYKDSMKDIKTALKSLEALGVPREDLSMLLPLGMTTRIVDKRNLRNLVDMSHQRLCKRAYWEYRELMEDLMNELSDYSEEWRYIVENYFVPKCKVYGKCTEKHGCGGSKCE